jgi:sugar phosphate isomerase/epimerase
VEAAGYYDRSAADFRKAMDRAGLRCVSTHHSLGLLRQMDPLIEYGHELGLDYLICSSPVRRDPSLQGPLTLDDWRWVAGEFNRIGEKVKAAGMSFGYHNHGPEFGNEGGVVFYDELLRLSWWSLSWIAAGRALPGFTPRTTCASRRSASLCCTSKTW